ncbi:HPr kinase/phosphatase C-terminal domain-containing protein [Octadecabacter sp. G9-8]|uniref:HPr kinase/phosphatase C-terminal domain-containing protein n=1 Tax=Octadecabacter dasysiphoniae TaxID=2909341 RepID=A0ABS9CZN8_9RHOB|nr:HPr kinase/phosphatase C-terminal domain-containing protein [Octadecabacter dasysiphoniae]MCF2871845.1 HPr kinase/phosphatase C-terminal domain-containing protein [Octadecabacter dasysiphoniae]
MLSVAPKNGPDGHLQLHASTVVINGKAVAFTGPSGSGKSGHAFACMARGAQLLADDITWLEHTPDALIAHCPAAIDGQIEARGIGLLNAPSYGPAPLHLIVDLGRQETARLPEKKSVTLLGHDIHVLHNPDTTYFVDAVLHYMLHGSMNGQ